MIPTLHEINGKLDIQQDQEENSKTKPTYSITYGKLH